MCHAAIGHTTRKTKRERCKTVFVIFPVLDIPDFLYFILQPGWLIL